MVCQAKAKVMVLGGGFGGLESAFYLKKFLRDRAEITLISDQSFFLFKPNTIYIPFGLDPEKLKIPLDRPTRRKKIDFIHAPAREIDPATQTIHADGQKLSYDYLVVATGAGMRPEEIPGLKENAQTIWTPQDMLRLRQALRQLLEEAKKGQKKKVLFLVPPNNKCAGPLYEMVLMLDTWARRQKIHDRMAITWTTFEQSYIQAFGPRLHDVVTHEFDRRGIQGHNAWVVEKVEKGEVIYKNGGRISYDLLISFPPYIASTPFPGLPVDDRGFLLTDSGTRQVKGHPEIYAVGDAGDFPVKQAFLAFLQADAASAHLSSQILGVPTLAKFDPISMCVMEQFDQATFAQVPLRLTGIPERPIEVRPEDASLYKVGTSPLWRLGKKLLGLYLPWRFGAGNPFHAGIPWKGMEIGLKVMSKLMAA